MTTDKELLREAGIKYGRRGGKKTLAIHGKEHFSKAGKTRWEKERANKKGSKKTK